MMMSNTLGLEYLQAPCVLHFTIGWIGFRFKKADCTKRTIDQINFQPDITSLTS